MTSHIKGFTLIEILVAVAIFGLLSIAAYTILDAGMRSREQTESRLNELETLQRAMLTIEKDLRLISQRQVRDEYGVQLPLLRGQSESSGQLGLLEFTRSGWRNPAGLPRSNLQHIIYTFDQSILTRNHSIFLDQASNSPQVKRTLLENVISFELQFLDDQKQWINSWAMLGGNTGQQLPRAIKLILEVEVFGKIERLLVIGNSN